MFLYPHLYRYQMHTRCHIRIHISLFDNKDFPTIPRQIHHYCLEIYVHDIVKCLPSTIPLKFFKSSQSRLRYDFPQNPVGPNAISTRIDFYTPLLPSVYL